MNYYNEWDPQAAAWLRELIENKLIPEGVVDERSITEVQAKDLKGFTQCHFFAGIGGWPLALQLAGIPATTRLWTGSPPCQPFSAAGKQLGQYDPRHLAPVFLGLISQCHPAILFGEQVAPAIAKSWMCDLQAHLEGEGYAVGFAVLPACSVGAPHKRDRLFFGAIDLADTSNGQRKQQPDQQCPGIQRKNTFEAERGNGFSANRSGVCSVADTDKQHCDIGGRDTGNECGEQRTQAQLSGCERSVFTANPHHGFWSDADWLGCRDGKFRPVEPGTFPLANGIPARVGRLRGYGNAIVPQVAAEFIKAFMAAKAETETKA